MIGPGEVTDQIEIAAAINIKGEANDQQQNQKILKISKIVLFYQGISSSSFYPENQMLR